MDIFEKAILFATEAHSGAIRKGDGIPYILHPFEVAAIAGTVTADEEVLTAALLHDTVEDAGVTLSGIEERFGVRVARLVASETEDKMPDLPKDRTWRIRKEKSFEALSNTDDPGVKILWLSDKLANMRSFFRLKEKRGAAMWDGFNQKDPDQQRWYYETVAELTKELSSTAAWREYSKLVSIVFEGDENG